MTRPARSTTRLLPRCMAEFNAEIAELRRELLGQHDATVAQIKAVFEKEVATLQRQLADARAELSKLQMLDAFAKWERDETSRT